MRLTKSLTDGAPISDIEITQALSAIADAIDDLDERIDVLEE